VAEHFFLNVVHLNNITNL